MKRDAPEVLKLGAKKEIVVRFFQENGIPPEFLGNEITGTIHLKGVRRRDAVRTTLC